MKKQEKLKQEGKSIGGLLAKINRLEKKLDLLNTLGKTMPVVIISAGSILGSLVYLSSVATFPENTSQLPQTGEETQITEDFIILYPEYYSEITLPDEVIGLSINGFYTTGEKVTFYAQKSGEENIEIGSGEKDLEDGEYKTIWENAASGTYTLWAEIETLNGTKTCSTSISVNVK